MNEQQLSPSKMKILAIADSDDFEWRGPEGGADVIVGLGDLADSLLLSAARHHRTTSVLAVKGNHDGAEQFCSPIRDAHLKVHEIDGVRFGGFGGAWRYKPRGHHLFEQSEVEKALARFPAVDVFISHNSPRFVHERDAETHQGFLAFTTYIETQRPRVLLHGHQHLVKESILSTTRVVGVFGYRYYEFSRKGTQPQRR